MTTREVMSSFRDKLQGVTMCKWWVEALGGVGWWCGAWSQVQGGGVEWLWSGGVVMVVRISSGVN